MDGAFLIDRTPTYFEPILNYLRTGSLIVNPDVNPEGTLLMPNCFIFRSLLKVVKFRG